MYNHFDTTAQKERFIKKLYRLSYKLLNAGRFSIIFDLDMPRAGTTVCQDVDGIIKINPLLGDRVLTLLHEIAEYLLPDVDEEEIESIAAACYRQLAKESELRLLKFLKELRT